MIRSLETAWGKRREKGKLKRRENFRSKPRKRTKIFIAVILSLFCIFCCIGMIRAAGLHQAEPSDERYGSVAGEKQVSERNGNGGKKGSLIEQFLSDSKKRVQKLSGSDSEAGTSQGSGNGISSSGSGPIVKEADPRKGTVSRKIMKMLGTFTGSSGSSSSDRSSGLSGLSGSSKSSNTASPKSTAGKTSSETKYGTFRVSRVVDGDTFIIRKNMKNIRVRILEVDTPESVSSDASKNCVYGKKASRYTKKRLEGKKVRLTFDREHEDRYGRKLCYVYLSDRTFYNRELARKGMARSMIISPNTLHEKTIKKAERYAKKHRLGVWSKKAEGKTGW